MPQQHCRSPWCPYVGRFRVVLDRRCLYRSCRHHRELQAQIVQVVQALLSPKQPIRAQGEHG